MEDGEHGSQHPALVCDEFLDGICPIAEVAEEAMKKHNGRLIGILGAFIDEVETVGLVNSVGGFVHGRS
jgi:hypothetical protein